MEWNLNMIMEWHLNIPKIFHIYWGAETLPYLRFMTIKTFMKFNPDWKIMFWYPKYHTSHVSWYTPEQRYFIPKCTDFMQELMKLPITKITVDLNDFGISNDIPEVHKSDFIRLHLLSTYGGLWSDMDILYTKPMGTFYLNKPENKDVETYVCNNEYGHSIGFLMACKENKFFLTLRNLVYNEYDSNYYQTLGARLYNKYFSTMDLVNKITPAINISMDVVYPSRAGDEEDLLSGKSIRITEKTLGVHWFAGHPQWSQFFADTDGGLINLPNCIVGDILKTV